MGTPETCRSQPQRRGAWGGLRNVPPLPVEVSDPTGAGLFLLTWRGAVGSVPPHWALRRAHPRLFPTLHPVQNVGFGAWVTWGVGQSTLF